MSRRNSRGMLGITLSLFALFCALWTVEAWGQLPGTTFTVERKLPSGPIQDCYRFFPDGTFQADLLFQQFGLDPVPFTEIVTDNVTLYVATASFKVSDLRVSDDEDDDDDDEKAILVFFGQVGGDAALKGRELSLSLRAIRSSRINGEETDTCTP